MKKTLTLALAAAAMLSANAADFTVYNNGTIAPEVVANPWWNVVMNLNAASPDGEGSVFELTYNPSEPGGGATGPNFCCGLQATSGSTVTGPIATSTLTFKYYATTSCDITVRLSGNGVEENQVIAVGEADINKWNTASLSVAEKFPQISTIWNEWKNEGLGDVLGLVVEKFNADTKVYINDVVYTGINENWVKPEVEAPFCPTPDVPTYAAENVVSIFSGAYTPATAFNVGGWGQSTVAKLLTAENGAPVYMISNFNYLGWEFAQHIDASNCDYMHVDFWPVESTAFGFTPISPGAEKGYVVAADAIKVGEWNHFDVELSFWDNVNFADLFQVKFDQGNGASGYIANVFFYKATSTGIEAVATEDNGTAEYFDLQGRKVANPAAGLFIKVVNGKATKVSLR